MVLRYPENFFKVPPANFDGVFHWDYLNRCFPRGIEFTDIDGVVEIGGNLLFIETKDVGKSVPLGQAMMYRVLLNSPNVMLFILWGKTEQTVSRLEIYDGLRGFSPTKVIDPASASDVMWAVRRWCDHANWLWEKKRLAQLSSTARPA